MRRSTTVRTTCSASTVFLGACLLTQPMRADWQVLGQFGANGRTPVQHSATTANGAVVRFTLAPDCVPCGQSIACYEPTTALVEYQETVDGSQTTAVDLRFSYATGASSVYWWSVEVDGFAPCFLANPFHCNIIWGFQGSYPCQGMCQFHFTRFEPADSPVLSLTTAGVGTLLSWNSVTGAASYDVLRGSLNMLISTGGDFASSTEACIVDHLEATSVSYEPEPGPGAAVWFLVRAEVCGGGTYNSGATSQTGSRDAEIVASLVGCP